MNRRLTIIEYCRIYKVEPEFLEELEENGLVEFGTEKSVKYVLEENFADLERFRVWHYELHVNMEGIDVIRNLLEKQAHLKSEVLELKRRLGFYE
ncbi:MerR family transcriptional regulator [Flavobacterium sp. MAH-1]|uniref:MerR family transcriptional regulator n=1 Tax=Flavobacterium agri TaxID=2743471 RepID=A0A7Y8Y015_9FLAO|nr:chaperone modulator CbpM [Flavobacterium agri]NUY79915.1 MerR family transcriptional regulator [Flavobacterium agri]NYA69940.1 MerR family transcriptional regulator [Flavobacterium agri]